MRTTLICLCVAILALALSACGGDAATGDSPKTEFISIGTGSQTGVYYPTGSRIAELVNGGSDEHGVKASAETSDGSVFNINAVVNGKMEFGLAQSDRQFQAVKGQAEWDGKPQDSLRAVCSLHPEVVHLVAVAEAADLAALKGRKVSVGNAGSGQRQNAIDVLTSVGIDPENDISAEGFTAAESPSMLQDGRIDAFFYTVGLGAAAITEATTGTRQVRLLPIVGAESLLEKYPYFSATTIPAGTYPKAADGDKDVPSVGMLTTLVTSTAVSDEVVYQVTKTIFSKLDELKAAHPALAGLEAKAMVSGLSAPIHAGAQRYFDEAGIQP
ncbi:MAG: TAXI family TRAP transporter solute-binding subunit [Planctomycetota bacterium]|jgi:TRAP transporter TAXI family solute receptor|nr:TAXI family TRAP transporter solute-binding subunit [Planctomycetota bacterium]